MTDYLVFTSSIVLAVATGAAACLLVLKRRPGARLAASSDGAMLRTLIDNLPDLI